MNPPTQSDMTSASNGNNEFIPRAALSRHNSSLMDVIGIGTRTNNTSSTNLAMNKFIAVTDPLTTTTSTTATSRLMNGNSIQRMDSPFRTDLILNPPLQRTTSIFNDTINNNSNANISTDLNDFINPLTPSTSHVASAIAPASSKIQNVATSNISGFMPNGVPMPPPGLIHLYVSQWKYIDHQGEQQGPFPSDMMSQWYHNNYFQLNLQLLITNPDNNNQTKANTNNKNTSKDFTIDPLQIQNKFITLNELILKVGNAIDPFATYDSIINSLLRNANGTSIGINPLSYPQQQPTPSSIPATTLTHTASNVSLNQLPITSSHMIPTIVGNNNTFPTSVMMNLPVTNNGITNGISDTGGGANKKEQIKSNHNISVKTDTKEDGVVANIHSGDYTFDEILDLPLPDGAYYHQVLVPIPMQRKLKKKIDPQTIIEPTDDLRFTDIWAIKEIAVGNPKPFNDPDNTGKKIKTELCNNNVSDIPLVVDDKLELETKHVNATTSSSENMEDKFIKLSISNTQDNITINNNQEDHEEEIKPKKVKKITKDKKLKNEEEVVLEKRQLTQEEKRKIKAELMAKQLIEEEEARIKLQEAKLSKKSKNQKEKKSKVKKNEPESTNNLEKTEESNKTTEEPIKSNPDKPDSSKEPIFKPAPWANKNRTKSKGINLTSFFELQRNEEIKQQKIEAQKKLEAMQLSTQILKEEQEKERNKAVLTWANSTTTANNITPTVDIKGDLLKDQEQKKKAKRGLLQQNQLKSFDDIPSDPTFIEEQQRIWEQLQKASKSQKVSNSNISKKAASPSIKASTTTTSNTNAWTKVTSKSKKISTPASTISLKPQPVIKPTKQIGSSTSIPSLKNKFVSNLGTISPATVTTRTATPMYPGNASISKRQEFLKWCKSQLKLNPGISSKNVLEVLLSLPAGPESNEIIADTIYSHSTVMDGRRFAIEFNKRRVECEKQVTDPLSWSEALALPEGNDDDWEFQVVTKKKKGKRH